MRGISGIGQGRFQGLDGVLALIECCDRIDIQVRADTMAELIGNEFGIDSHLSCQCRMRAGRTAEKPDVTIRQLARGDFYGAGWRRRIARHGCASASGSRARGLAAGCSAERCACPWPRRSPRIRTIRPLTLVVALLASLLLALPAPAHAPNHQLNGTAAFDLSPGTTCPVPPSAYDSYDALVMSGSLGGCWYTNIETARTTPGGVYLESGTELFVGQLDDGPAGTFTTTYKFEAKLNADGAEVRGRCQHQIVSGSGTGGFAGATGRVDFKDIIGDPITYVYRGHISLP